MFKSDDELHEFALLISDDNRFQDVTQPIENVYVSLLLRFENWSLSCKDTSSSQIKTSFSIPTLWYSAVNSKVRMNGTGSYSSKTLAVSKPHVPVIHVELN